LAITSQVGSTWPKPVFMAGTELLEASPDSVRAVLRASVFRPAGVSFGLGDRGRRGHLIVDSVSLVYPRPTDHSALLTIDAGSSGSAACN
jgi:hypothetical protein